MDNQNNFNEGDKVVCISDNFPKIEKYGGGSETPNKPKKGEVLFVDEILGDFLRFDKYDTVESFNWWHHSRFRKAEFAESENKKVYYEKISNGN